MSVSSSAAPPPAIPRLSPFSPAHWAALVLIPLAYAVYIVAQWSLAYIDFGDGNYIYIGRRIADGAIPYRDILAPQPPNHLYLGAVVWELARALRFPEPVYAFRCASLLIRLASYVLIVILARRAWGCAWAAVFAGAIYLYLPIGTWWSLGWQSEPLETLFLLAMLLCVLRDKRPADLAAGLFAGMAALTNATSWPFLVVVMIYAILRARRRVLWIALPALALFWAVGLALNAATGGAYFDNVIFNQVGTFLPFSKMPAKLIGQGKGILVSEGVFILLAVFGLFRFIRASPLPPPARGAVGWFLFSTLGSFIYVVKGGTMDYIFSLADPAIALFAAGALVSLAKSLISIRSRLPRYALLIFVPALLILLAVPSFQTHRNLWNKAIYELSERGVDRVVEVLHAHSKPGDQIFAPPFYAVRADRDIWGDYSEIYIWHVKYLFDRLADPPNPLGPGWTKLRGFASAVRARNLPIIAIDLNQTGQADAAMFALMDYAIPLKGAESPDSYLFYTRNTRLVFFTPAPLSETPEQAAARRAEWIAFKADLLEKFTPYGVRYNFSLWYDRP